MQQKKLFGEAGFEFDGSVNFPENIEKMIDSAIEGLRSSGHEAELNCCNKLKNVIEEYKAQVRTAVVKKADKTTCLKQVSYHGTKYCL